jgi:hypothetical protein
VAGGSGMNSLPPERDEREILHLIAWVVMIIGITVLILVAIPHC